MSRSLRLALAAGLAVSALGACKATPDCSSPDESAAALPPSVSNSAGLATAADASRAISEADIVQLDTAQDRIYAMSKNGGLVIVDAATPAQLTLLGKTTLPGQPFEMYRSGNVLLTMTDGTVSADGTRRAVLSDGDDPPALTGNEDASLIAVDVTNPASAQPGASLDLPGQIADSRIIGNILYIATFENGSCFGCTNGHRTVVTSFDVSAPATPRQVAQVSFATTASEIGFNAAWATPWERSIIATDTHLYVGGLAAAGQDASSGQGEIAVLDISDPTGKLASVGRIPTAGPVMSRWQMDEAGGVLRVVSQAGAGATSNGTAAPVVETFNVASDFAPLGQLPLQLPRQEGLKTVRFDGARGYAITFNQTDPLFTIDLSNPAKPLQKGQLQIPGWMFYLEPHGDKLIGLGLDRTDKSGNLNVSLFDVTDMTTPTLLKRVSFGPSNLYEDFQITDAVIAEDQDRIQKAFRVDQDGLISVPFSGSQNGCTTTTTTATGGGVQLLDWSGSTLTKRGLVPMAGNPRRAIRRDSTAMSELIAVSDSDVSAFSIENRDAPAQLADVVIGTCVARSANVSVLGDNDMRRGEPVDGVAICR